MADEEKSSALMATEENEVEAETSNQVGEQQSNGASKVDQVDNQTATNVGEEMARVDGPVEQTASKNQQLVAGLRRELARFSSYMRDLLLRARQKCAKLSHMKARETLKSSTKPADESALEPAEENFNETATDKLIESEAQSKNGHN